MVVDTNEQIIKVILQYIIIYCHMQLESVIFYLMCDDLSRCACASVQGLAFRHGASRVVCDVACHSVYWARTKKDASTALVL